MKEFEPFLLDTVNQCLWRRGDGGARERILLKPKAFGVLQHLVDHAGRLVTQEEILEAVWPDAYVQPEVLKRHIADVRSVLGDDPRNPAYIETRHWLGYQFIAPVRKAPSPEPDIPTPSRLAGRDQALRDLRAYLGRSFGGERQIVFVAGEPGIGKSALVDEFQRQAAAGLPIRIARGQCAEGFHGQEPYYPMLEALGTLCRELAGASVLRILQDQAPAWMAQFPSLSGHAERDRRPCQMPCEMPGATKQRMLAEIGHALETIASERPLLLILEDLHWADSSTIDLISALARGRGAAKLMVIGTYRPGDFAFSGHPLRVVESDLLVHRYVMNSFWSRCGKWK